MKNQPLKEYEYLKGYTIEERLKLYSKFSENTKRYDLSITFNEVEKLKKIIKDLLVNDNDDYRNMFLSSQDILLPISENLNNTFDEILKIAKIIRKEIVNLRTNSYICLPWLTNISYYLEKSSKENLGQFVVPDESGLIRVIELIQIR
ncbi:uncharacterized protein I206_106509 [Kwoniella pini CBS 10737]|uniref:Uncharacterized protein n=1 Tax=Kwoniella pini CBS 10737 TaxID=1296096 RepID=A0A1B9HUH6_9TREE|nr:uncharacterized protein I206_07314 [Kwoniella pini CBS 10737]OCF46927.1 hypothetical protein I206_07314 [Kwoniella pini CBS 10737]